MPRAGKTKNYSVSLGSDVHHILTVRAASVHDGNLSAAVAEAAELLRREVALTELAQDLERAVGPLTDEARARLDLEWSGAASTATRARASATPAPRKPSKTKRRAA
jgi:hypothetical protein